jgi:hypothetical protein
MPENVRKLREIEFFNLVLDKWVKTTGFYPENWVCARPGCIRTTKGSNRYQNEDGTTYCSYNCRGLHLTKKTWRNKRWKKKDDEIKTKTK